MFDTGLDHEHMLGQDGSMRRTYVRRRRGAVVLVLGLVAMVVSPMAAHAFGQGGPSAAQQRVVVVRPGDTLWGIARQVEPGIDPRETVHRIAEANGVDPGALFPGQALVIPAA